MQDLDIRIIPISIDRFHPAFYWDWIIKYDIYKYDGWFSKIPSLILNKFQIKSIFCILHLSPVHCISCIICLDPKNIDSRCIQSYVYKIHCCKEVSLLTLSNSDPSCFEISFCGSSIQRMIDRWTLIQHDKCNPCIHTGSARYFTVMHRCLLLTVNDSHVLSWQFLSRWYSNRTISVSWSKHVLQSSKGYPVFFSKIHQFDVIQKIPMHCFVVFTTTFWISQW